MKKLRKTYWYLSAFLSRHWKTIVGATFLGIIIFQLLVRVIPAVMQLKPAHYIGRVGMPTVSTLPRDVQQLISDGLTHVDENGTVLPSLAERWSIEEDGKVFRFILKQDLYWQDGKRVEPSDISYNFSDTQIVYTQNEVLFRLKDPFVPFPVVVSQPLFRQTENGVVGTGPYKVQYMKKKMDIVEELRIDSLSDERVYRFYPTEDAAVLAYKKGEVDTVEGLSSDHALGSWKWTRIVPKVREDRYVALFFNTELPLYDKPVRQALNYALRKPLDDERILSPVSSASWAANKTVKSYDYNLEKAIDLILKAVPKEKWVIELRSPVQFQDLAFQVKKDWEDFGSIAADACSISKEVENKDDCNNLRLEVRVQINTIPDLSSFQVMLIGQEIPPDPDQYALWHSTQGTNIAKYKSPKVDKLLEDGRKTLGKEERKRIYQDFQQYLVEDTPAIFISYLKEYGVYRKSFISGDSSFLLVQKSE